MPTASTEYKEVLSKVKNELKHTAHSSYRCEYHVVFAPKYRRKVIYNEIKKDIGEILRKLCNEMKVEIIEAEACPDHIHMLVSIPPYMSVAQFMGTLKSKSALMIFDRHANLKYKYGNRNFWCRGYYVDTVGKNEKMIKDYIRNQLEEDYTSDQISLKEFTDPFTGEKRKKKKKRQPLEAAACNNDAMVNPQYPFKGQQVLTLIGSEQSTSLLVVMIRKN